MDDFKLRDCCKELLTTSYGLLGSLAFDRPHPFDPGPPLCASIMVLACASAGISWWTVSRHGSILLKAAGQSGDQRFWVCVVQALRSESPSLKEYREEKRPYRVYAECENVLYNTPMPHIEWTEVREWAKVAGAAVAFGVAILQYIKAQTWKRMEFVAQQIEKFRADPIVKRVFTMLDWRERRIDLGIPFELNLRSGELSPPRVTYQVISEALRSHHAPPRGFSSLEAAIRDHFDGFLDYLIHFEHFIETGLIRSKDIGPYLEYWTCALVGEDEVDEALLVQFWRFVDEYKYSKARKFIFRFHPHAEARFPKQRATL